MPVRSPGICRWSAFGCLEQPHVDSRGSDTDKCLRRSYELDHI